MRLPIKVPNTFRIIAHRGASAYAPENTIPAFKLAVEMGVMEVELDTQLSADGKVVLCHDTNLERYGHGNIIVEETVWDELASLDMGSWFSPFLFRSEKMITLNQLFDLFHKKMTYHIELKGKAKKLPEALHRLINEYELENHCIITSFSYASLVAMNDINPQLHFGWLVEKIDSEVLANARAIELFQICPCADAVTKEIVAQAHKIVPEVRAWGVNGTSMKVLKLILNVIDSGCDGMTINWPDWVSY